MTASSFPRVPLLAASLLPAAGVALALTLAVPATAHAQSGYATTMKTVHLRAGPGREYPAIAVLGTGTTVEVQGCVQDWTWCDVSLDGVRGWVYAGNLAYPWQGTPVPIRAYGPQLGLVIVPFVLFDYWRTWYPDRPWYRDRWRHVHPHPYPPPPPPHPPRPPRPPGPVPVPPPVHPKPPPWRPAPLPPNPPPHTQPAPPHAVTPLPRRRPDPGTPAPPPQAPTQPQQAPPTR